MNMNFIKTNIELDKEFERISYLFHKYDNVISDEANLIKGLCLDLCDRTDSAFYWREKYLDNRWWYKHLFFPLQHNWDYNQKFPWPWWWKNLINRQNNKILHWDETRKGYFYERTI